MPQQLSLWALEPMLCNKRSLHAATRESPCARNEEPGVAMKTEFSQNKPTNQTNKQKKKPNPTNLLSSGGQKSKIKVLLGSAPSESFREESVSSLWRSPVEGIPNLMNFTTKVLSFKLKVTGILNWQV